MAIGCAGSSPAFRTKQQKGSQVGGLFCFCKCCAQGATSSLPACFASTWLLGAPLADALPQVYVQITPPFYKCMRPEVLLGAGARKADIVQITEAGFISLARIR